MKTDNEGKVCGPVFDTWEDLNEYIWIIINLIVVTIGWRRFGALTFK